MLEIVYLSVENFRLFEFMGLDLRHEGLVHVGAVNKDLPHADSNESGKSTILNAITWCLYGCDTLGNQIATTVVRNGCDKCEVNVVLKDILRGDANPVEIRRIRNNNPKPGLFKNSLYYKDYRILDLEKNPEASQHKINQLLGPKELFLAAHIFGYDEGYIPFAKQPERTQKSLFDHLINSEDMDHAHAKAATAYTRAIKIKEALEWKAKSYIETVKATANQIKAIKSSDKKDINKALEDALHANHSVDWTKERLADAEAELTQALDAKEEIDERLDKVRDRLVDRNTDKSGLQTAIDGISANIEDILNTDKCSTCGQEIDRSTKARLTKEMKASLRECIEKKDKLLQEVDFSRLTKRVEKLEEASRKAEGKVREKEESVKHWEERLEEARTEAKAKDAVYLALEAKSRQSPAKLRTALSGRQELIQVAQELAEEEAQRIEDLAFWKEGFGAGGIRAYRLDKITPQLNEIAARYSDRLYGNGCKVVYTTQKRIKSGELREKFDVYLENPDGERIETLSAGQAMRRDLIHLFSTVELAESLGHRKVSFLAFDEAFRTLDRTGKEAAMCILRELTDSVATILVLEHDQEMESQFDRTITVTRENNTAKVEIDG